MKIWKIALNNTDEQYQKFKKYLLSNLYMWDKLPSSIKNNRKLWDIFLSEYPQFYSQFGLPGNNENINKKLADKWKKFILSNPDLMQFCPVESLKTDINFLKEIHDYWVKELIDAPYTWNNIPEYVFNNGLIWEDVFKIKPTYKGFKPNRMNRMFGSFSEG